MNKIEKAIEIIQNLWLVNVEKSQGEPELEELHQALGAAFMALLEKQKRDKMKCENCEYSSHCTQKIKTLNGYSWDNIPAYKSRKLDFCSCFESKEIEEPNNA